MLPATLQRWFERRFAARLAAPSDAVGVGGSFVVDQTPISAETRATSSLPSGQKPDRWPATRTAITNQLWGQGFTLAGGEMEILQLLRPLGLSSASSLLLIGGGGGGPAGAAVRNLGVWVNALEDHPTLVANAAAMIRSAHLDKKAKIGLWDPNNPDFARGQHHHGLAIEPLRSGSPSEPIFDRLSQTVKPGGQLVLVDITADIPAPANDTTFSRWSRLEGRPLTAIPNGNAVTRMMTRVGFDVRIAEDISGRHIHHAMIGWRAALRALQDDKPTPLVAAQLVAEAEAWLLRVRLLKESRLRMMRWHAIRRGPSVGAGSKPG